MNLGVIGSRSFINYNLLKSVLNIILWSNPNIDCIVSGEDENSKRKSGADALSLIYSRENNIKYIGYAALWDDIENKPENEIGIKYGKKYWKLAGHFRNKYIIKDSDLVVAFWDGKSPGTKNSLNLCKTLEVPFMIIDI